MLKVVLMMLHRSLYETSFLKLRKHQRQKLRQKSHQRLKRVRDLRRKQVFLQFITPSTASSHADQMVMAETIRMIVTDKIAMVSETIEMVTIETVKEEIIMYTQDLLTRLFVHVQSKSVLCVQ